MWANIDNHWSRTGKRDDVIARMRASKRGTTLSENHKRKIRDALKGRKPANFGHGFVPGVLKGKGQWLICVGCGGRFQARASLRHVKTKYCTRACWLIYKIEPRKGKKWPERSGPKHHNWKGGITKLSMKIRNSLDYKRWRAKVFERDDYTCLNCEKRGGRLNADHIKPFSLYPDLRFSLENGRTLCVSCHRKIGWNLFRERNPRRKHVFGVEVT